VSTIKPLEEDSDHNPEKTHVNLNVVCLLVFNATFNNISAILWRLVLFVEETGGPGENHQPVESH
jgi:hypothetical protein